MSNEAADLKHVVEILKEQAQLPRRIDISKIGSRFWISSYDTMASQIISDSIFTGMSNSKEKAVLKALSEKVERMAAISGAHEGLPSCQTESSDGFACLPRTLPGSKELVRDHALNEAVERFAWATWWDDPSIEFEKRTLSVELRNSNNRETLAAMMAEGAFQLPICIVPKIDLEEKAVFILFAPVGATGFVSGGACGSIENSEETIMRGLDELFRHAMGLQKMRRKNLVPSTFYEMRLAYFGLGHGDNAVRERLAATGTRAVRFPPLVCDEEIPHALERHFVVHRCLYENQPPFIGGRLERLCL